MREKIIEWILQEKVIAIARGITPEQCLQTAQALHDGGIRLMEVTFDQKDLNKQEQTLTAIESLCRHFGDAMAIGAGTVTTVELVEKAAKAGAKYIISPDCQEDVIRRTRELGLVSIPGCLTPTEITTAHRWGADFVKLFPAGSMGIGYVKAVKAPLNHIRMLAVGGVDGENITDYLEAGCCGAGVGGNLVNKKWIEAGQYDKLTETAAALTQKLTRYK
jgi:2-dehydro-3-deoxyphosphogluconate aldolase/(4S)-4-hydroxy-2-oxoglutarate aldolase